jgi:hypothetical protein
MVEAEEVEVEVVEVEVVDTTGAGEESPALSLDGGSLSAGCLAGRSGTSAVVALALSSAACPCTSSLKPISPLLGGNGPACVDDDAKAEGSGMKAFNAINKGLHRAR